MHFGNLLDALLLGIIEGVTEFIPVSSTAHLLLAGMVIGYADPTFTVLIQFGAILALLSVYAGRIIRLLRDLPYDRRTQRFALGVIVAFLPAAVVGALFHHQITAVLFASPVVICVALILGGIVLLFIDRLNAPIHFRDIMQYPVRLCFAIGLFQCLALIPAAEFSFFLAIPTMLGAFVFDIYENGAAIDWNSGVTIAVGFVAAFISALYVVRTFLGFVSRYGLAPFGWWRIVVGVIGLVIVFLVAETPTPKTIASGEPARLELAARPETNEITWQDGGEAGRVGAEGGQRAAFALGRR
jgi:undecaprenyl-diphosphatase